jgi:hypothetical protein
VPISEETYKENAACIYNGILFSHLKNPMESCLYSNMNESGGHYGK